MRRFLTPAVASTMEKFGVYRNRLLLVGRSPTVLAPSPVAGDVESHYHGVDIVTSSYHTIIVPDVSGSRYSPSFQYARGVFMLA